MPGPGQGLAQGLQAAPGQQQDGAQVMEPAGGAAADAGARSGDEDGLPRQQAGQGTGRGSCPVRFMGATTPPEMAQVRASSGLTSMGLILDSSSMMT